MIFVTVGTQRPFDRLVLAADQIPARGEAVVVQCGGSCMHAKHATQVDFLPFHEFEERIRSARVVVAHAGIGSVALCLRHGHRPIVVPRLRALGEAIDDHQIAFARRLAEMDVITLVEDIRNLDAAIAAPRAAARRVGLSSALSDDLVTYISRYAAPELELARSSGS